MKFYYCLNYTDGATESWISEDRSTHIFICYSFGYTDKHGLPFLDLGFTISADISKCEFMPHPYSRYKPIPQ